MEIKSRFDHFNINVTDLERSIAFIQKQPFFCNRLVDKT